MLLQGSVSKLEAYLLNDHDVAYSLKIGNKLVDLLPYLGKEITISYLGEIKCYNCAKLTKKSFGQGYCFLCFRSLPECDQCLVRPELCHYHLGTCRDSLWGEKHCFQPHIIYLADTGEVKVGITRIANLPRRWLDQGAVAALPIMKVYSRYHSGLIEVIAKKNIRDKTNWRKMLVNGWGEEDIKEFVTNKMSNLCSEADRLKQNISDEITLFKINHGEQSIEYLDYSPKAFVYPQINIKNSSLLSEISVNDIENSKLLLKSIDLEDYKESSIFSGKLIGIKGQYLIFDKGLINLRKYVSYQININL